MTPGAGFWRRRADGIEIVVRLTPRSSRDAVDGVGTASDGSIHLRARVRAVPEKGKANEALARLIAETLGMPAGSVAVVAGGTSRLKTVAVSGDPDMIGARLEALAASA